MSKSKRTLTLLGRRARKPVKRLEAFPNTHPERKYRVVLETSEFTSLCPVTGQPDFGAITISYVPDRLVVESKSLKLYLWSYRQEGHFHEEAVNRILDDMVRTVRPRACEVRGVFNVRGGIGITVVARYPEDHDP
ncbi:MAG TPA: NADPH-dependent 7-cyano-7-deazaguanine reductase QueF [candidate division Zixibacteria bacterium]|nr:NADPH-dependent 7-cyano-7-deazaguanine reductase QueF [candidate division Zixibacteria bacterium]